MQRLSTGVQTEGTAVFCHVHVQTDVRVCHRDVRPFSSLLTELVHDGILHFVRHEFGVTELITEHYRVNGKGFLEPQILSPVNLFHLLIDLVSRACLEVLDGFENTDSGVQLEIGAIHEFLIACERHHASSNLYVVCPQLG